MPLLASLGVFAAVALACHVLVGIAQDRATVRAWVRQLEGPDRPTGGVRERKLFGSLGSRLALPAVHRLTALGRRFTPVGYAETTRRKLATAGRSGPGALDRFLFVRAVSVLCVPAALVLVFFVLRMPPSASSLGLVALLGLVAVLGPDARLNREVAERQHRIRAQLPDVLDLLVISVEAGLGFDQALDRTVSAVPGPLAEEFNRMVGQTRAGATRAVALRALAERVDLPEVRSFVTAIAQADAFGVSIGRILRSQAEEMRIKRRQLAQEQAQKAPVKMLIPMVFCVFPALFVVLLGPAILNIRHSL